METLVVTLNKQSPPICGWTAGALHGESICTVYLTSSLKAMSLCQHPQLSQECLHGDCPLTGLSGGSAWVNRRPSHLFVMVSPKGRLKKHHQDHLSGAGWLQDVTQMPQPFCLCFLHPRVIRIISSSVTFLVPKKYPHALSSPGLTSSPGIAAQMYFLKGKRRLGQERCPPLLWGRINSLFTRNTRTPALSISQSQLCCSVIYSPRRRTFWGIF